MLGNLFQPCDKKRGIGTSYDNCNDRTKWLSVGQVIHALNVMRDPDARKGIIGCS